MWDDCFYDFLKIELTQNVGCTTPSLPDKSNICKTVANAKLAKEWEDQIMFRNSSLTEVCPKSCLEVYTTIGNKHVVDNSDEDSEYYEKGNLTLFFHQFVKVSKAYWEYDGIELMAEIGGYVGLFLGVSVNQIRHLIGKVFKL